MDGGLDTPVVRSLSGTYEVESDFSRTTTVDGEGGLVLEGRSIDYDTRKNFANPRLAEFADYPTQSDRRGNARHKCKPLIDAAQNEMPHDRKPHNVMNQI